MAIEIFPVIHVNEVPQAAEQAEAAGEARANGVYLIDHRNNFRTTTLVDAYNTIVERSPNLFVGLNFLQIPGAERVFAFVRDRVRAGDMARLPDGIWVDDANPQKMELKVLRAVCTELSNIIYLGGVAFKYTPSFTDDPEEAAKETTRLSPYVDVVATSGRGTGKAPSPEKIRAMKQVIGNQKLAIASGINTENITQYAGSFDQLLVSTGIETEPYSGIFVPKKLKDLTELGQSL